MGLFRRKKERAIPEPGSREFDEAVEGSALPDPQSVSMGEQGWTEPDPAPTSDERKKPRRREGVIRALGRGVPNSGGFGAGIPSNPKKKPE